MPASSNFGTTGSANNAALVQPILDEVLERESIFSSYFSRFTADISSDKAPDAVILEKRQLVQEGGDQIIVPLLRKLTNEGTSGDLQIKGKEEAQSERFVKVGINQKRHAVKVMRGASGQRVKKFNFMARMQPQLSDWWGEEMDFDIFQSILEGGSRHIRDTVANGGLNFDFGGGANTVVSNPFVYEAGSGGAGGGLVAFGASASAYETNVGTAVTAVGSADIMALFLLDNLLTEAHNQRLRPIKIKGENLYVVILHPNQFDQLSAAGSVFQQIQRDAGVRGDENPIFTGAKGFYKGCIIHVHPYIPGVTTSGGKPVYGTTTPHTALDTNTVKCAILLGGGAILKGIGEPLHFETEEEDYMNVKGVAAAINYGSRRPDWTSDEVGATRARPVNPSSFVLLTNSPTPDFNG